MKHLSIILLFCLLSNNCFAVDSIIINHLPYSSSSLNEGFTVVTEKGIVWSLGNSYAKVTGYANNKTTPTVSWLISPAINTTKAEGNDMSVVVDFDYVLRYVGAGTDIAAYHKLYASTDFNGDVKTATWIDLGFEAVESATKDWTFYAAPTLTLPAALVGQDKVYFAFRFECNNQNSTTWELKNFKVHQVGNLIANGTFETWRIGEPVYWHSTTSASSATLKQSNDARSGDFSVLVEGSSTINKRLAYKEITLKAGNYNFKFYAKAATSTAVSVRPGYVPVKDGQVGNYSYGDSINNISNREWVEVNYSIKLTDETTINLIVMNLRSPGSDVLIDDAELTTNNGDIIDDFNVIESNGIYYNYIDKHTELQVTYSPEDTKPYSGRVILPSRVEIDGVMLPVTSIGDKAFAGCTGLISIEIPSSVTRFGYHAFSGCSSLSNIYLNCKEIGTWFSDMTSIKVVELGDNVTSIIDNAFKGCDGLESLELSDGIIHIGNNVLSGRMLVNKGTKTLLTIWNYNKKYPNYAYTVFSKSNEQELLPPAINVATTQTTAIVKFDNVDLNDGFTYSYNNETLNETEIKHTALKPDTKQNVTLVVSKDETSYTINGSYTTMGLNPRIDDEQYEVTASSIRAKGSYTEEDAKVVAQRMYIRDNYYYNTNDITNAEGEECFAFGLNPGRRYSVVCEIDVDYGGDSLATFRGTKDIYTKGLQFSVAQPKVVNLGNAIVSASVNLDPEEENVGFEWRRTDWTNEFPSNTGKAYLYEGVLEGYIKNLNTDKLWKFRPYYLSDDGTYHYGDWMGLDPTNTSYFEPTVHTYAKINIEGNTALVRGYALAGTDNIKVQGFKYWKTSGNNAPHRIPSVPTNAQTIDAIGQQIITATLAALEYSTTYHYVAFVTTEDGITYYGEEQVFTTPMAPAGIDGVIADEPTTANTKKGVYTLTGVKLADKLSELQGLPQGVYIVDGKKVMVR